MCSGVAVAGVEEIISIISLERKRANKIHGWGLAERGVKTETTVTTKIVTDVKKEKKVYSLPGQKHDPPEERDAFRIFYSTLREQKPESEMAEIWLMEYGLLPHDEAEQAFERKQKLRGQAVKSGAATKSSTPSRGSNGNNPCFSVNGSPELFGMEILAGKG